MKTADSDNKRNPLKDKPLRLPGQSDADKIRNLEFEIALYIGIGLFFGLFAIYIWLIWISHSFPHPLVWSCLALIVIAFCYYKIRRLFVEKRKWELG
ncbi:MAG: hypothetical protein Q7T57_08220 [Dehalococcoidales bacterium]|nr:hypothetical protein [Dehalococcoidales bacterium]